METRSVLFVSHLRFYDYYISGGSFASDVDANRGGHGGHPGKKMPKEVLLEMEANAKRAGCHRGCLICLSHIKVIIFHPCDFVVMDISWELLIYFNHCTVHQKDEEVYPRKMPQLCRRWWHTGRH